MTKQINIAHANYQSNLFNNDSQDYNTSKRFWKYIKSLKKDQLGVTALVSNGRTVISSFEKASILNNHFYSVFTKEDLTNIPEFDQQEYPTMS